MSRIDEIREREKQATPGPWVAYKGDDYSDMHPEDPDEGRRCDGIAPVNAKSHLCWDKIVETDGGYYPPRMKDAEFIAHARADIPWLLKRVEQLEAGAQNIVAAKHRPDCRWAGKDDGDSLSHDCCDCLQEWAEESLKETP